MTALCPVTLTSPTESKQLGMVGKYLGSACSIQQVPAVGTPKWRRWCMALAHHAAVQYNPANVILAAAAALPVPALFGDCAGCT